MGCYYFCDRCAVEIKKGELDYIRVTTMRRGDEKHELCNDCTKSFWKMFGFWSKPKKEVGENGD